MRKIPILLALLSSLGMARIVHADARAEARKHFDRAVELVDDGQLEGAAVEFQRSYDLTHHFAVLYNIGQVMASLTRPVEAYDAYQRYLSEGRDQIPAARRAEVEKEMARQKARIATLEVRGLPDGASVRVDGKEIGKGIGRSTIGIGVRVGVGRHSISAAAEGYDPATSEVTVAGEDHRVVNLSLVRSAVVPAPPPVAPPALAPASSAPAIPTTTISAPTAGEVTAPAPRPSTSILRTVGIVAGAVGVAGLGAGTAFWFTAKSRQDEAMRVYQTDYPKAENLHGEALDFVTATNIALIAGGALATVGVVAFIVGKPDRRPDLTAASTGMRAHLLPTLGPGGAGLRVAGIW